MDEERQTMVDASRPLAEALIERKPFDHTVTLRDHVDAALIIKEFIAEHEGELTPEIEALMLDNENQTKEKVTSIAWYVKVEAARIKAEKELIAGLQRRVQATENRVEWMKQSYLMDNMKRLGLGVGDSLKGTGVTVRLALNNPRIEGEVDETRIQDLYLVPVAAPFVRHRESFSLDKVPLLNALKAAIETVAQEDATTESKETAIALMQAFPELSVVRDESVRIG